MQCIRVSFTSYRAAAAATGLINDYVIVPGTERDRYVCSPSQYIGILKKNGTRQTTKKKHRAFIS